MTLFRLFAVFLTASLLSSCQTASTIAQEPFVLLNDMFSSVGRVFHSSANDRKPGDSSIEAAEAEEAHLALSGDKAVEPTVTPASSVALQ